jgi:hypothetical protein
VDEQAQSVAPTTSELARAREERQAVREVLRAVARGGQANRVMYVTTHGFGAWL